MGFPKFQVVSLGVCTTFLKILVWCRISFSLENTRTGAGSSELPSYRPWKADIPLRTEVVWKNVFGSSKNPNHQLIHYKICHTTYLTPHKRHLMGLAPNPYCTFCSQGITGTLMHVLWECPDVQRLWVKVVDKVSDLVGMKLPLEPALLLLNDDSRIKIAEIERKLWLAGMTAAKKIIVLRWLPPHQLSIKHWLQALLEVI